MINILIVDDLIENLFSLNALISSNSENFEPKINIYESKSGEEALKIAFNKSIDLIILDIQMPEMNGFETAKFLKSNSKTKDIPIIFLTAVFKSEEFIKNGFDVGGIDYLTKPVNKDIFLKKIKNYISMIKTQKDALQTSSRMNEISKESCFLYITVDVDTLITDYGEKTKKLFPNIEKGIGLFDFITGIEDLKKKEKEKFLDYLANLNIFSDHDKKTVINYKEGYYEAAFVILPNNYLLRLKDITKEYKLKKNNEQIKIEHTKELKMTKERFLTIFTHELKTPLNGIISFSSHISKGIEKGIDENNKEKYLNLSKKVQSLGKMMLSNVNAMLEISRLNESRLKLVYEKTDLKTIIDQLVSTYGFIYEGKTIYTNIDNITVDTDKEMITHIFENIFTNSMKYGNGQSKITLTEDDEFFYYCVEDDGEGIDEDLKKKIYDIFEQGENKNTAREKKGTGIGLHLVKKLCEVMEYEIHIDKSEILNGAKFTVKGKKG